MNSIETCKRCLASVHRHKSGDFQQLEMRDGVLTTREGERCCLQALGYPKLVTLPYDIDYKSRGQVEADVTKHFVSNGGLPSRDCLVIGFTIGSGHDIDRRDLRLGVIYPVNLYGRLTKK